jgi:adenylate cyclase
VEDAHAAAYLDAFAKLEARDSSAVAAFAGLISARPGDPLAQYHLKRLLNGGTGTRIETGLG